MSIICEARESDSPYIETVMHGRTASEGSSIRPAEIHWHMVFVKHQGRVQSLIVGPLPTAGVASWGEGADILWIKFKLGTFIPHLPAKTLLNEETTLSEASSKSFWLKGSAWQFPNYENVETFVNRLVRDKLLNHDPIVDAALHDSHSHPLQTIPSRTMRHRFLRATGLSQGHIHQVERAHHAKRLLEHGVSILDTVYKAGYFDQPHLTRSLKQFVGFTPAQIANSRNSR